MVLTETLSSFPILVLCKLPVKASQIGKAFDIDRLTGNTSPWCDHFRSVPRQIQNNPVLCVHLCVWSADTVLHLPTVGNRAWRSLGWLNCINGRDSSHVALHERLCSDTVGRQLLE